jgi:hypothetical protein
MSHEQQPSGVSVRDLLQALEALQSDQGATGRIVLFREVTKDGTEALKIVVQACDAQGRVLPDVPSHSTRWPTNQFKTLTQAFHWYVGCLYDSLEYMRYNSAQRRRSEGS